MAKINSIRVWRRGHSIAVTINKQEYSAEAFEATDNGELGITNSEAETIRQKIEALRVQIDGAA